MSRIAKAAATSGTLFVVGDAIAQRFIEKEHEYDVERTLRFATLGALLHGPYFRIAFDKLDKVFPVKGFSSVVKKSLTAQVAFFPPYIIGFFFCSALLEGKSGDEAVQRVKNTIWPTLKAGTIVWPVCNALNFMFLPPSGRIIGLNVVGIGWNSYLSYTNEKARKTTT